MVIMVTIVGFALAICLPMIITMTMVARTLKKIRIKNEKQL